MQGYSKDGHPELKQLMMGLATTRDGIPVLPDAMDGNTPDKVWNLTLVRELSQYLPAERLRRMRYVADSALVTKANLAALAEEGYRFVSRLPGTFGEADEVRDAAFAADAWTDVGALSPEKNAPSTRCGRDPAASTAGTTAWWWCTPRASTSASRSSSTP